MKKITSLKNVLLYLLVIVLYSCKSNKEIRQLSSQVNCTQKVYFVWDPESNFAKLEKIGAHKSDYASFGKGKRLDYKDIFIQSINELNKKYNGTFMYTESPDFPSDSVIVVRVKLEKEIRNMGYSKMITDMQLVYTTHNKELNLIGTSNGYKGTKRVLKCFESANLKFLIANCDE